MGEYFRNVARGQSHRTDWEYTQEVQLQKQALHLSPPLLQGYETSECRQVRDICKGDLQVYIYLDEAIYKRAKCAHFIDPMLKEISKKYLPSGNYQFVKEVLEDSEDIIVWQEQGMELLHRMGGFSYAEADILRSEGGKGLWKKSEWYSPRRKKFLEHAIFCGYDYYFADKYFRYICKTYGRNDCFTSPPQRHAI